MCVLLYWGHSPSREPRQSPRPPLGLGIPSPRAEIAARPLPTLPRRESGRARDKETLPPPLPAPPPAPDTPQRPPSTRRHRAWTLRRREGDRGASRLPDAGRLEAALGTPHPPLPQPSRAPGAATLAQAARRLSSGATGGRGAHKAARGVRAWRVREGAIPPGPGPAGRSYLPDFFLDLRDVGEDEADHQQRERGQHPAPERQLHGGFAPRDREGWGAERGWGLSGRRPSLRARCAAGQIPRAPGESGPAAAAATAAHRGCSGAASQLSPRLPPAPSLPLPSPFFSSLSPPCVGLRAQFDSFAPRLCSPPPTPATPRSSHPPWRVPPACFQLPGVGGGGGGSGTWLEPATPSPGRPSRGAACAQVPSTAPRIPSAGKRPAPPALCPAPPAFSKSFPDTKTRTWGPPPARGQEAASGRQTLQRDSDSEGRWGESGGGEISRPANSGGGGFGVRAGAESPDTPHLSDEPPPRPPHLGLR